MHIWMALLLGALTNSFAFAGGVERTWVCNAYGMKSGARSSWQTVTGPHERTQKRAKEQAMRYCQSHLSACSPAGCWEK